MITRSRRSGFTLMEVLLATTIAVFIMVAILAAMEVQIREMEEGRTKVERATVGRSILAKMSDDISSSLAPVVPTTKSGGSGGSGSGSGNSGSGNNGSGNSGNGSSGGNNTGGTGSNMGANGNNGTGNSNSATTATTSSTVDSDGNPVIFQIGVKGDNETLTVFQTRMTRGIVAPPDDGGGTPMTYAGDVWRVSYFLAGDRGLARQEIRVVTSDDVDTVPIDVDDNTKILAEEVKSVYFRYFDGTTWQDSWDGSTPGADGVTPQGPPMAVEITLTIGYPGSDQTKTIQDVVAFHAAQGSGSQSSNPTTSTSP
jgi:hypothetical protein